MTLNVPPTLFAKAVLPVAHWMKPPFDAAVILPLASTVTLAFVYEPAVTAVVESAVAPCVPVTSPAKLPVKFVALVAVAALPLMLMPAVPALILAAVRLVRPAPLPVNVPLEKVTALLKVPLSCALAKVPLRFANDGCEQFALPFAAMPVAKL